MEADQPPRPQVRLEEASYIRHKLHGGGTSLARRYADLVVGPGASHWEVLRYELLTLFLGGLPGALGLAARRIFYPRLFRHAGRGVVFGRDLTLRNARNISLGDRVVIDDQCVLDARGAGPDGVVIGDGVIINRGVSIQAKIGPIRIGAETDVGMGTVIHSQGGVEIGSRVVLGGGCELSGGIFQTERTPTGEDDQEAEPNDASMSSREQQRFTRGPIRLGDKCLVGMRALFLDGVHVGEGAVIGAGSLVNRDVPPYCVAAGLPARVVRRRPKPDECDGE